MIETVLWWVVQVSLVTGLVLLGGMWLYLIAALLHLMFTRLDGWKDYVNRRRVARRFDKLFEKEERRRRLW